MKPRVVALHLSCGACGAAVRITPDDADAFAGFGTAHLLPTIDSAEVVVDGALRSVQIEIV